MVFRLDIPPLCSVMSALVLALCFGVAIPGPGVTARADGHSVAAELRDSHTNITRGWPDGQLVFQADSPDTAGPLPWKRSIPLPKAPR